MPPRREVKSRPARRNVKEQRVPNALEVQPQGVVTNVEFREAIWMLSQVATYQVGQRDNRQEVADTSRICELSRLNPPSFTGSSVIEDLENFMEELKRLSDVTHVADTERAELSSKEGKATMLIGDMDLIRLMIHVQQVEEDKLKDRE
ncbi:uncharacterized protein LOC125868414 [Solanum stenotomum]|uniref:uncharacterized protein LOC125868414 n=1 Tax=Solanum stenotomum TaxID=172797 RepID=UPI0020D0A746|nr:uncharacterized protein LOC125868414 [Solanum stenotomum]